MKSILRVLFLILVVQLADGLYRQFGDVFTSKPLVNQVADYTIVCPECITVGTGAPSNLTASSSTSVTISHGGTGGLPK